MTKKIKYVGQSSGLSIPGVGEVKPGDVITVGDTLAKQLTTRSDFAEHKELRLEPPKKTMKLKITKIKKAEPPKEEPERLVKLYHNEPSRSLEESESETQ